MYRSLIVIFLLIFGIFSVSGQEENQKNYEISGYVKNMQSLYFMDGLDSILVDNLIHNRLNFKWYPNDNITAYIELRNRIFFGDIVRLVPEFGRIPDINNDYFDLSFNLINANNLVFNTTIDRAYLEFNKNNWEVRLGRQRINWGINVAWNPNDIFNAYSFFDFDYEERPGSDAIRIKRYTGIASSIEFAANISDRSEEFVVAGMWKTNIKNYDFQFLAGKARNDWVLGGGWAGNIKTAGFKGEFTWFKPIKANESGSYETMLMSLALDYSFPNTLYLNGSVLWNSNISTSNDLNLINTGGFGRLDIKNLLPYKYATFLQASYSLTPLINTGLAWMTFPGESAFFVNPTITVSVTEDLDADLIGQFFFVNEGEGYSTNSSATFLRIKYSF